MDMAKLVAKFSGAELTNVTVNEESQSGDWQWRKEFIGSPGSLSMFESEHLRPGQRFVHLNTYDGKWLTTSCGEIVITDSDLTITTTHSVYRFQIGGKETQLWVDEKTVREP